MSDALMQVVVSLVRAEFGLVYSCGVLLNCTTTGQASDSMTALALSFNPLVGAWCLSLAGPTVAQLEDFFSSDYLRVITPFLCFIIVC